MQSDCSSSFGTQKDLYVDPSKNYSLVASDSNSLGYEYDSCFTCFIKSADPDDDLIKFEKKMITVTAEK